MDAAKQTAQAFAVTSALWLSIFALLSWAFPGVA